MGVCTCAYVCVACITPATESFYRVQLHCMCVTVGVVGVCSVCVNVCMCVSVYVWMV